MSNRGDGVWIPVTPRTTSRVPDRDSVENRGGERGDLPGFGGAYLTDPPRTPGAARRLVDGLMRKGR